jgi:phospholipid transport system substrate-binding protein
MRVFLVIVSLLMTAGVAQAMTPTETVRSQVDQALRTGTDASSGVAVTVQQRRSQIRRAADGLFDFTEMSRRALGRYWPARSQAERDEFVKLFADLMARAYLGKIDRYAGESITYVGERVDGDLATVDSRVITAKKTEVPIEYRLHQVGDRWAAYDVLVENVSLVGTYRSQFDRIIQTSSFAELLKRMRQKEQESVAGTASR